MSYEREREGFRLFREKLREHGEVREQMVGAIRCEAFTTYDTRRHENRFIAGGIFEYIIGAALRVCGVPVHHKGMVATDYDLLFDDADGGYSIKSMFGQKTTSTRLVNVLASEPPTLDRWKAATLFLLPWGIVYADPELPWWAARKHDCIRPATDALAVKRRCIEAFAQAHPEWVVQCVLISSNERAAVRPVTSADAAARILMQYPALFRHFPDLRPGEEMLGQ